MINTCLPYLLARLNLRDQKGQTAVEYAMVLVLVSLAIIGILVLGISNDMFDAFWAQIEDALNG